MKHFSSTILLVSLGVLASSNPLESVRRLIKTSADEPAKWMSEKEIWSVLIRKHRHFIDITDHTDILTMKPPVKRETVLPCELSYQNETRNLIKAIDSERVQSFVKHFSSYHTRYYKGNSGVQSQNWLKSQIEETLLRYKAAPYTVEDFHHPWPQSSIIARIEGADPDLKSEVIVFGAHQDSINIFGGSFRAPGADDNAAGSVVIFESLRALVDSGFIPKRTIEFQWYAAEEVGLRGSAAIAQAYRNKEVNVVAMLNFDVPGYQEPGVNDIGIYTDNTDPELNDFLRTLTTEYLDYGWQDRKCGYGCSDHASWTNYNYPSAMPAEVKLHPQMHTSQDNFQRVGFTQINEFIKLSLATISELGEPGNVRKEQ